MRLGPCKPQLSCCLPPEGVHSLADVVSAPQVVKQDKLILLHAEILCEDCWVCASCQWDALCTGTADSGRICSKPH